MYSVILTELGISVLNEDKVDKAFSFSNPVKEYLAVKNKESKLNELIDYLAKSQRGFSVSDESLLAILKKFSIDCHIMDSEELEKIQTTKPQIIVDSGFASNLQDTLGKLREFALGFSSSKVTEVSQSPDLHIIQAINSLDEIDKIANGLSSRLREWYGLHFPELDNMIDSINGYSQIVMAGKRESLSKQVFEEAGFPESKVEMLSLILAKSRGGDISDINLAIVQSIAKQILDSSTKPIIFEGGIGTLEDINYALEIGIDSIALGHMITFGDNNIFKIKQFLQNKKFELRLRD